MKNNASRINELHNLMVRRTVQSAFEIGKLLKEQKESIGHGNWEKWMEENLEFSSSTAKRYINVYEIKSEDKSVNLSDLKLSELYEEMSKKKKSKTPEEKKTRRENLKKQDAERKERREKFANREYDYNNPPKGKFQNEIICGRFQDVMPEMIDNGIKGAFDALICSVPYNNDKNYGDWNNDSKEYDEYLAMLEDYIRLSYVLLRRGGRLIINFAEISRKSKKGDHHHMLEADIINLIRKTGLDFYELDKIIWYKENSGSDWINASKGSPSPESLKLKNKFETILIFSKQEHNLPALEGMESDLTEDEFKDWTENVWTIHPVNKMTPHPASYVEKLTNRLIKLYSWKGGLVGDFFCGSGTTCKSAQELGRRFVGVDQNPNYAQYSRDRLDLTKDELKKKYAEFIGGKRKTKISKVDFQKTDKPRLQVSKLNENITFKKKSA